MITFEDTKKLHGQIIDVFAGYGNDFGRIKDEKRRDKLLSNVQQFLKQANQTYLSNKARIFSLEKLKDMKSKQEAEKLKEENRQLLIFQNYWYSVLPEPYNAAYKQRYYFT